MPNQNFTPPKIAKGDIVLWYPEARKEESHSCTAFVNYVSGNTVGLTVFRNGLRPQFIPYVRHADDPFLKDCDKNILKESGGWDYSSLLTRVAQLESALQDLSKSRSK